MHFQPIQALLLGYANMDSAGWNAELLMIRIQLLDCINH